MENKIDEILSRIGVEHSEDGNTYVSTLGIEKAEQSIIDILNQKDQEIAKWKDLFDKEATAHWKTRAVVEELQKQLENKA